MVRWPNSFGKRGTQSIWGEFPSRDRADSFGPNPSANPVGTRERTSLWFRSAAELSNAVLSETITSPYWDVPAFVERRVAVLHRACHEAFRPERCGDARRCD